jgi:hypothetical protein
MIQLLAIPFVLGGFILWGMLPSWMQFRAYLKIKARLFEAEHAYPAARAARLRSEEDVAR